MVKKTVRKFIKKKASASQNDLLKLLEDISKTREELVRTKEYAENIVKSIIDTLVVINPDKIINVVNKSLCDLLGYKEEELLGKDANLIFWGGPGKDVLFKNAGMKKLITGGFIRDYELAYRTKSGEKIPVSFSGSVMREVVCPRYNEPIDDCREFRKKGFHCKKIIGIVAIARDMREMKRLMKKEKELAIEITKTED